MRGYGRKNISPRCTLKIDLQKAFDSVNWCFLLLVLKALKFPEIFRNWIEACITSHYFSISLNGSLVGYFKGAKGVRQGDPLSPFLFVIAMEVLSRLLEIAARQGIFKFHPKCSKVKLTHLIFADDLLIFVKGSMDFIVGVRCLLDGFYFIYGLQLNVSKSDFFFARISNEEVSHIFNITGCKSGTLPVHYLGVPLVFRRLSCVDCKPLVEMLVAKILQWSPLHLSYIGRLQLIKAVLFSVQAYWCIDSSYSQRSLFNRWTNCALGLYVKVVTLLLLVLE
ncbi:hypothetical protein J1N35_033579 [Gossypium stocksii]|uniref:Reverse transcriptase domain-containing protein n=1 Tax=Gossypium stocksii TaxID=47602 RepID=A0A9D3UR91_9ROSI|nr:hypothetical protein J1N35_033579 [Gossypium stocksii]